MNSMIKKAAAGATLIAAIALATTPSQARWNCGEAAAAGFVAGAAVGAAATSSYYGPRAYGPGYGYGYYGDAYAYEPAYSEPVYGGPVYGAPVYAAPSSCWIATDDARGFGYYGPCTRFRETPESRQGRMPNN